MQFYIHKTLFDISFMFWAVVTLMLLTDRTNTALIAFLSAVIHEIGHLLFLCKFSAMPQKVTLGIFGMRIDKKENTLSFKKEAIVALAGPMQNIILFLLFYLLYRLNSSALLLKISMVNLLMFIFNMIPTEPLDGYRAIKNALSVYFDEQRTEKFLNLISLSFLVLLLLFGLYLIKIQKFNFTLLIFCIYIFLYLIFKNK